MREGVVDFYRDVFYKGKIFDFLFDLSFVDERMDDYYRFLRVKVVFWD